MATKLFRSSIVDHFVPRTFFYKLFHKTFSTMSDKNSIDDLVNQVGGLDLGNDDTVDPNVKKVAKWISSSKKIVILTGAGISTSASIPDFRSPGTGLYDNLQKFQLPYAEAIFDIDFYQRKPRPFLTLAKELWPGLKYSPTLTHSFIATMAKEGHLLRLYTQNIDGLEVLGGTTEDKIVECHGHFRTASCIKCKETMDIEKCKETIMESTTAVPMCTSCDGFVKPDIVFFGEGLPDRFHNLLQKDMNDADLLIVLGTSLQVAPVSQIPNFVKCKRVLINRDKVGNFRRKDDEILLGDCDTVCMSIAKELGWEEPIRDLNKDTKVTQLKKSLKKEGKK